MLRFMGSQRIGHDWATELNRTEEVDSFRFREKQTPQSVGHRRGQVLWPWNVVRLVFCSWVISYANEWEDHSNNWGTTHSSGF